jgi:hypothetical protein
VLSSPAKDVIVPQIKIHIGADGVSRCLYTETLAPLAKRMNASTSRISHVEPVNWLLRVLFYAVRAVFGEDGRSGRWLRTWKCRWRVNFDPIGGSIYESGEDGKPFATRQAAIDFEIPLASTFLKEGKIPHVGFKPERKRVD